MKNTVVFLECSSIFDYYLYLCDLGNTLATPNFGGKT